MKTQQAYWGFKWSGACALVLAATCAWAGIVTPLYVGNIEPVCDQNGVPLCGSYDTDPAMRSRVEIRTTTSIVLPPSIDGSPHPINPLLSPDSVGGIGMNAAAPGLFAMALPLRPSSGTKIFGRAFNAPTREEASFYVDAAVAIAPASGSSLVLSFGEAQPLDSGDDDGDGLINSWEKALGIDDRPTGDYDGDGMGDWEEMRAGTAPDDAGSRLAFLAIQRAEDTVPAAGDGGETRVTRVRFSSVPGKRYQLEYMTNPVGAQVYVLAGSPVEAGDGEYELEVEVEIPVADEVCLFRIRLLEEEEEEPLP